MKTPQTVMIDVVMEEEKRRMNASPPIRHVARRSLKARRSGFIYINLSLCQPTFLKHPHVIISWWMASFVLVNG